MYSYMSVHHDFMTITPNAVALTNICRTRDEPSQEKLFYPILKQIFLQSYSCMYNDCFCICQYLLEQIKYFDERRCINFFTFYLR